MTVGEAIKQRNLKWYEYATVRDFTGMIRNIPSELLEHEVKEISVNVGVFLTITIFKT